MLTALNIIFLLIFVYGIFTNYKEGKRRSLAADTNYAKVPCICGHPYNVHDETGCRTDPRGGNGLCPCERPDGVGI